MEDDPLASLEAAVASTTTLTYVPIMSMPPPPHVLSSVMPLPVVLECILNASFLHLRLHFQEVSDFIISLPPSHTRRALGVTRLDVGMADLVIADISENMLVPNVSDPAYSVPSWIALDFDFLGELFDFMDVIIHDDRVFLLFHPDDNGDSRENIHNDFLAFGVTIFKEWLGVNRLRLHLLSMWTRPPTFSKFYYLFVPRKQLDLIMINNTGTRHFAFTMSLTSRLLALSSTWMMSV